MTNNFIVPSCTRCSHPLIGHIREYVSNGDNTGLIREYCTMCELCNSDYKPITVIETLKRSKEQWTLKH